MAFRLVHNGGANALFADGPVIRKEDVKVVKSAAQLLSNVSALAQQSEADHQKALEEGREQGLAEAAAQVDILVANAVQEVLASVAQVHEQRSADLAAMTHGALKEILGATAEEETIAALTRQTLKRIDTSEVDEIIVSPTVADHVAAALPEASARHVRSDPAMSATECKILTASGIVLASLDIQLDNIAARWGLDETNTGSTA